MITLPGSRASLTDLLKPNSIGAELGVFACDYSKELLASGKFSILYLVDPFYGNIGSGDKDGLNHRTFKGEELWSRALDFEEQNEEIIVQCITSTSFLQAKPEELLDFVYIDTTHLYEDTLFELRDSWEVTKVGGIIAGHDFNLEGAGVRQAVEEFCSSKNIPFYVLTGDGLHSFYFFKG